MCNLFSPKSDRLALLTHQLTSTITDSKNKPLIIKKMNNLNEIGRNFLKIVDIKKRLIYESSILHLGN